MKDRITPTKSTTSKSKYSYQELERAEMEREILKKAAAYFARQELESGHLLEIIRSIIRCGCYVTV